MGALSNKLIDLELIRFKGILEKERAFGQYPKSLQLFKESALSILEKINGELAEKLSDYLDFDLDDSAALKRFIKNNPRLAELLGFVEKDLNDSILDDVIERCAAVINGDEEALQSFEDTKFFENLSEITEKTIQGISDLLSKIDDITSQVNNFLNENMKYIEAGAMAFWIVKLIIDLLRNTDFPSIFRLKWIGKLIRYTLGAIWELGGEQFKKIKNWLTTFDNLLALAALLTATYFANRFKFQNQAIESLLEDSCPKDKESYEAAIAANAAPEPPPEDFEIDLSCPLPEDNFAPREPFESKVENFSCEIEPGEEGTPDFKGKLEPEFATKAKIINYREDTLSPKVKKNDFVEATTVIASLGDSLVYSPVEGYIDSISTNEIVLSDISDPEEDELEKAISVLNSAYQEQNEIKSILIDYEIDCLYPIMLKESPISDGNLTAEERKSVLNTGMEEQFKKISDTWYKKEGKLDSYEKNVKKITSKENIESVTGNQDNPVDDPDMNSIKNALDAENEKLFRYLLAADDEAIKLAKITVAKDGEYELLEYYIDKIVLKLNETTLENDAEGNLKYLPGFRKQMNDFVRQRYVVEGWKPKKIKDKAIELLKDLDKGITLGNKLWEKGLEKYNEKKRFEDIKKWLEEGIEPRKKLETNEIKSLINRIYFLYQFYLNIKAYTEDYKDLAEEGELKQTNKEGNYLLDFFTNLQVRLKELTTTIKETEEKIDDLSLLQIYTTEVIDNEEYRIYPINPTDFDCDSPAAKDVKSKYSPLDFRYWLKWCGYATAVGLIPLYWSTGFLIPGPIPFPVIYIPLKAIQTKWGVILIGLSITGIYPFPFIMLANLSSEYASLVPIPGLEKAKEKIEELKTEFSERLKDFKETALNKKLEQIGEKITELNSEVKDYEKTLVEIKRNRPPQKNKQEYAEWLESKKTAKENKNQVEVTRWKEAQTYQIINNAVTSGASVAGSADQGLKALEKIEQTINSKLDAIIGLLDNIERIYALSPLSLKPTSINFAFTVKNPKPIITVAENLEQNVNNGVLDPILSNFDMSNEMFMTGTGFFKKKEFNTLIKAQRFLPGNLGTVSKNPLPKYEDISPINFPFLQFLTTEFLVKGSQTYGIPGQIPPPVG